MGTLFDDPLQRIEKKRSSANVSAGPMLSPNAMC